MIGQLAAHWAAPGRHSVTMSLREYPIFLALAKHEQRHLGVVRKTIFTFRRFYNKQSHQHTFQKIQFPTGYPYSLSCKKWFTYTFPPI